MRSIKLLALLPFILLFGIGASGQAIMPGPVVPKSARADTGGAAAAAALPGAAAALTKTDVDSWLDGFMPFALERGDLAGAVVVIVKDGQVLTQRGFGYADLASRTPVDPDRTLFRPGSVSKLFTWTAVMQEVEAGRIDLDRDVNAYLDFGIPAYRGKPVTMRQLMTHTAGFQEQGRGLMFEDPKLIVPLGDYVKDNIPARIFAPGSTPSYSNYGTALAGHIVERVSGLSFDDYIEKRIFAPLGMAHSTFRQPLPAALKADMATGYRKASTGPVKFEIVGPSPAGGLSSTGADMARFMIAHLNDGRGLMTPTTARQMHDTPLTILPPLNRMQLGFFETNINGRQVIAHLGDTQLFHTALHLFTDDGVGIYFSVNSTGEQGSAGPVRRALFEEFADRYLPGGAPVTSRIDAATAKQHAQMLAGQWLNSRRAETNFFAIGNLLRQVKVTVGADGSPVVPLARDRAGKPLKWVEVAPFVWHAVGGHERLAAKVEGGRVVRWSIDGISPFMVFDRAPASQSAAWIMPLLLASLGVLSLTFLHWPTGALIRRKYKAPLAFKPQALRAYRGVRLGAGLVVALAAAWFTAISTMRPLPSYDPLLWLLQIAGLVVLAGGSFFAAWNLRLAVKEKRGRFAIVRAAIILLAMLVPFYVAWTFGLLSMTVKY